MVELLISRGADTNHVNKVRLQKRCALRRAVCTLERQSLHLSSEIPRTQAGLTCFHLGAAFCSELVALFLFYEGAYTNRFNLQENKQLEQLQQKQQRLKEEAEAALLRVVPNTASPSQAALPTDGEVSAVSADTAAAAGGEGGTASESSSRSAAEESSADSSARTLSNASHGGGDAVAEISNADPSSEEAELRQTLLPSSSASREADSAAESRALLAADSGDFALESSPPPSALGHDPFDAAFQEGVTAEEEFEETPESDPRRGLGALLEQGGEEVAAEAPPGGKSP